MNLDQIYTDTINSYNVKLVVDIGTDINKVQNDRKNLNSTNFSSTQFYCV
jgi:hypothetical protein